MTAVPGVGPQLERAAAGTDPRGVLVFEHLPDDLQALEDGRQLADRDRLQWYPRGFRPATDTERALLAHLGHTLPDELRTSVRWRGTIRCREWPALEGESSP